MTRTAPALLLALLLAACGGTDPLDSAGPGSDAAAGGAPGGGGSGGAVATGGAGGGGTAGAGGGTAGAGGGTAGAGGGTAGAGGGSPTRDGGPTPARDAGPIACPPVACPETCASGCEIVGGCVTGRCNPVPGRDAGPPRDAGPRRDGGTSVCRVDECGPIPPVAPCPGGGGPAVSCERSAAGRCDWRVTACPSPCAQLSTAPSCEANPTCRWIAPPLCGSRTSTAAGDAAKPAPGAAEPAPPLLPPELRVPPASPSPYGCHPVTDVGCRSSADCRDGAVCTAVTENPCHTKRCGQTCSAIQVCQRTASPTCPATASSCPRGCASMRAYPYVPEQRCTRYTQGAEVVGCTAAQVGTADAPCVKRASDGALFVATSGSGFRGRPEWTSCTEEEARLVQGAPRCP